VAEAINHMRGLKSTLALLVVLIGLGAYIYFVTWKQEDNPASKQEKVFQTFDAADVQEVKVTSESGDVTTVKKDGAAWQIVQPVQTTAAESEVTGITSALGNLEIVRVIDENPSDVAEYGLAKPRVEIEYKASKGSGKLQLGEKTATGANMYARRNDEPRVFLVAEYQNGALNKSTFDLRDKGLIKIERDKVEGVEVNAGGKIFQFEKKGTDWKLAKPLVASADSGSVEGLVGRVETAQMKSIVADAATPADLKKYGLEKPDVLVTLNVGSARANLALGAKADDESVYARDLSKPMVVTVDKSLAEDLKKPVDDYRRKDAFDFRAFTAMHAEFTRNGQTVVFDRVKGQGENAQDTWKRVSPNPADVDKSKMDSFLAGLADIRATSFTDSTAKTGLDKPALAAFVKFDEGAAKEERVTFGQTGSDVYFTRSGEPGAAKIEAEKFNEAIKALDELSK
jgi:uncharacterized protein DUF4340